MKKEIVDKIIIEKDSLNQFQYNLYGKGKFLGSDDINYNTPEQAEQNGIKHIEEFPEVYEKSSNGIQISKPD